MKPKHVVVCLIDAAGARHMSCYGYHRKTTPNIDAVAEEGVIFRKCFSTANYTMSGCGSFHTGRYPENHGAFYLERRLKEDDLTLAETMRRAGYATCGLIYNQYANDYMGFHIGFEHFDNFEGMKPTKKGTAELFEREAEYHARLDKWLKEVQGRQIFAFVHFQPPHEEYEAPKKFRQTWAIPYPGVPRTDASTLMSWEQGKSPYTQQDIDYVRDLYDENMLYADYNVGLVIAKLKELGMWDDTLFILVSDHGEAFMEHGFTLHNTTMYDEMIHVPLVLKFPKGMEPVKKEIDALVEIIDIYPSVADMLGISLPKEYIDGKSFMPLIHGEVDEIKEYNFARSAHYLTPMLSVRTLRYKYIYNQTKETKELYDMTADPLEKSNIIEQNQELAGKFHKLLEPILECYRIARGKQPLSSRIRIFFKRCVFFLKRQGNTIVCKEKE